MMALAWPLPLSEFFDTLPIARITSRPGAANTTSETHGGDVIKHRLGSRLWGGRIVLDKDHHSAIAAIEARLSLLDEPGASFLLWDTRQPHPAADPEKFILGSSAPVIEALNPNNRELDISGLPAGYILSRGDLLGFTYGANPTRYAYHRIATGAVASGAGVAADIEVTPFIRPGAALGAAITLGNPVLKATLTTAQYGEGRSAVTEGGSFNWLQTLR
ncbi:hypothetical protein [Leisingera sp. NJS201]|uniref:hypothetical protein n=2 Tax=unclassified Leisingera TaxID=2614906 RepID=UPI001430FF25|nr:hypothetical protein [Leisingera sp. NJS201]